MNEYYAFGGAILAGALLWTLVDEIRWQRKHRRTVVDLDDISLARRVARTLPHPLVAVEVSDYGVFIGSPDAEVVAEIVSCDPAFYARGVA